MSKEKNIAYGVLKIVTSFLLCLSLVLISGVAVLSLTFFSESYVFEIMEKDNYYEKVKDALLLKSSTYFDDAGIMQQMLPLIINVETIQQEIIYTTSSIYNGKILRVNKDEEFENLKKEILASFQTNEIEITPELEVVLNQVVEDCKSSYHKAVLLPYFDSLAVWNSAFKGTARFLLLAISAAFAAASWVVLKRLCDAKEKIVYIQCAFLGAGLSFLVPSLALIISGWAKTNLPTQYIYANILYNFVNGVLWSFLFAGVLLFVAGIGYGFYNKYRLLPLSEKPVLDDTEVEHST